MEYHPFLPYLSAAVAHVWRAVDWKHSVIGVKDRHICCLLPGARSPWPVAASLLTHYGWIDSGSGVGFLAIYKRYSSSDSGPGWSRFESKIGSITGMCSTLDDIHQMWNNLLMWND